MEEKGKTFLLGFTPVLLMLFCEFAVSFLFYFPIKILEKAEAGGNYILPYLQQNGSTLIMIGTYCLMFVFGILWRIKLQSQNPYGIKIKFDGRACLVLILAGMACQAGISSILNLLQYVIPSVMESYSKVTESLGIGMPTLTTFLYVTAIAPVCEELIFRGLTMDIMRRGFPFWAANLFQALLFGLIHWNVVQSTYAILLGIFLGYITKRYGTLKAPIFMHFIVNLSGQILGLVRIPVRNLALLFIILTALLLLSGKKRTFHKE